MKMRLENRQEGGRSEEGGEKVSRQKSKRKQDVVSFKAELRKMHEKPKDS